VEEGLQGAAALLQDDPLVGAEGIMTTDTRAKALSVSVGDATLTIVAKGAGMIEPNMATMLVYIFTDADLSSILLDAMLRRAAHVSFNMLSIDSDTSTSDTCVLMANGLAGHVETEAFYAALERICIRMAEIIARDGEGATKLLRVRVTGALNEREARRIAKSIVNSPLIKTMAFGADPNVGRILMAVGKCFDCTIDHDRFRASTNGIPLFARGGKLEYDEQELRKELAGDPVDIDVDMGLGDGEATAFGCDLTAGYIEENAAYFSS
jgi:glutamate N-acetyltransferase/amino-acid N-acetyltransferase